MTYRTARGPDGSWVIEDEQKFVVFGPCTKREAASEVAKMNDAAVDDDGFVLWFVRAERGAR